MDILCFYILKMTLSIMKKFPLLSAILLVTFCASFSFAADADELRQRLELLQRSLQKTSPDESREDLEKRLQLLKELLRKEGVTEEERKGLEEKLESLKKQLIPEEKPLIALEEAPGPEKGKRFFIEGNYWLAYTEGGDKEVASLYNIDTKQPIGTLLDSSLDPAGAFVISAAYINPAGRKTIARLWHLEPGGSLSRSATSTVGISATEASDYYYQNIHQWTTSTFSTKGVARVDADSNLNGTNLDLLHTIQIGKGVEKEFGVLLGIKYTQIDSNIKITYSSATSTLYKIRSDVENTLIGPVFGIYGEGPVSGKLRFNAMMDIALTWDHSKAKRDEYDYTVPQTALDARQAHDLTSTVIDGELGVRYPVGQNLSLNLDYKAAFFSGLPFELKTRESTFIEALELDKRDILFHGLTAGVTYSF